MSFSDLKISELKKAAESFGVDLDGSKTKTEIVALLEEEGITYQMYDKFTNTEKQEIEIPETEKKQREKKIMKTENSVLVKMERGNHSYQTAGHTFTRQMHNASLILNKVFALRLHERHKSSTHNKEQLIARYSQRYSGKNSLICYK